MRADPGFDAILFRISIGANDEGPASVIFRDLRDELRIFLERARSFAINREIDERRASQRAFVLCPKFFQLLVDLGDLDREPERIIFSGCRHDQ